MHQPPFLLRVRWRRPDDMNERDEFRKCTCMRVHCRQLADAVRSHQCADTLNARVPIGGVSGV